MPGQLRKRSRPGDYVAILAYVPPTPEIVAQLQDLRAVWGEKLGCATTLGVGPRYLHSTGQLHKGGPNTGLFLVITTEIGEDLEIPSMVGRSASCITPRRAATSGRCSRAAGAWPTCTCPALRSCRS